MIYQLTLTGLILGSTATVTEAGTTNILGQVTNHGSTTWTFNYSDGGFAVDVRVVALGMAPWSARVTLPAANSSIPVDQAVDRSLLIPVSARAAAREALEVLSESEVQALIDAVDTGGGTWGSITGTLADQTDLQSALNARASTSDPRFTDPRTPTSHKSSHATGGSDAITPADIGAEASSNKGQPGGYASLDGSGQIPAAQIPTVAITEYLGAVADEAAMLSLSGQRGDWCVRTDTGTAWIITGANPATLAGWTQFVYPAAPVSSVAGRTGAVTLSTADVSGLGAAALRAIGTSAGQIRDAADPAYTNSRTPNVVWIGAGELIPRVTTGAGIDGQEFATNRQNLDYLAFDPGTAEFAQASFAWPGASTTATARLYWTAASGSGDVVWRVALRCYADDDAIDQAFGTAQSVTDALLAAGDVHQSDATSAITPAGAPANRRLTIVQVERNATDGADTLAVDARLIGVLLEFA